MHVKRVQGVFKITVLGLRWDILLTVFKDPNNINVTHHIHKRSGTSSPARSSRWTGRTG